MMLLRHAARAAAQRTRVSCTVRHLSADTVTVSVHEAQSTTAQALRKIGWDDEAADVQAEIMTAAELCGNNQGLVKMFNPSLMAPQPGAGKPVVERETATSAAINANQAPGMLAAVTASDLAAGKALENNVINQCVGCTRSFFTKSFLGDDAAVLAPSSGEESASPRHRASVASMAWRSTRLNAASNLISTQVAVVSAYNTSTSSGQLAFYAERQAKRGLVCLALANSPEFVRDRRPTVPSRCDSRQ